MQGAIQFSTNSSADKSSVHAVNPIESSNSSTSQKSCEDTVQPVVSSHSSTAEKLSANKEDEAEFHIPAAPIHPLDALVNPVNIEGIVVEVSDANSESESEDGQ